MLQIITNDAEFKGLMLEAVQWAVNNMPTQSVLPKPEIMTGDELCEKLDVTIQTLIRWRQKGKIPFMQIGSSIRYDLNKVLNAIEVNKKKGAHK